MQKTTDLEQFKFLPYNREVNSHHVKILTQKIQLSNELQNYPIHVTKEMEVINGQHRLTAAKALRLPIYFEIIDPFSPESLLHSNFARQWTIEDYVNYYAVQGSVDHQNVLTFAKTYDLPIASCFSLLTGCLRSAQVKDGKVDAHRKATLVRAMRLRESVLNNINESEVRYRSVIKTYRFLLALFVLMHREILDEERLEKQLIKFFYKITGRGKTSEYLKMFAELYNHGLMNKVEI